MGYGVPNATTPEAKQTWEECRIMNRAKSYWEEQLNAALRSIGGQAAMSPDIYEWVERNSNLTPHELEISPHQGRPWYYHTLRATAS